MKATYKLSKDELSQAVADFVARKLGKTVKIDVSFHIAAEYDFADRPTGTHTITATANVDEEQK